MTFRPPAGARRGQRTRTGSAVTATVLAALCLLALFTPSTTSGYSARITNPTNKAGTAAYFLCTEAVRADIAGALFAYRLNEATGSAFAGDFSNNNTPGTYRGQMTGDTAAKPACPRDAGGAYTLNGSTSYVSTPTYRASGNTFSIEVWFKTSTGGGKLIGFGNASTGTSTIYDRHLYLTDTGQVVFGVYPNQVKTVVSPLSYTDGTWHHAVATLSGAGMNLYIDAQKVATDPATTTGQSYAGYWRIGYDNLAGWGATQPANFYYKGSLRFAAAYTAALTPGQVTTHYNAGR